MIRRPLLVLIASITLVGCGSGPSPAPASGPTGPAAASTAPASPSPAGSPGTDAVSIGKAFLAALASGDDATAEGLEDAAMHSAAPAATLGTLWQQLIGQFGTFERLGAATTQESGGYTVVTVQGEFADATVPLLVSVSGNGQVGGLHIGAPGPASSPAASGSALPAASPAAYVDPAAFSESDVTVGSAPWALPGTLSMPKGSGPFPAVVLVAGSGPQDRDETIGPNKPLRDLAWGLASSGIAVLRYDKRTLVYGARMAAQQGDITVKEETTDDALAAIALLRSTPGIDPARVFVVGHSLGAYLAPRIAAGAPGQLRGIAMLEAPSSTLAELILMQERYLVSLGAASPGPSASAALADLVAQVQRAESASLSPSTPASDLPLGIPARYWLDLRTYDPLATAGALELPMDFTQGGRDYQVPSTELQPWQRALASHSNVTFTTYPALDHLLFEGSGPATPAEYTIPSHVAPQVVADLAAWVLAR